MVKLYIHNHVPQKLEFANFDALRLMKEDYHKIERRDISNEITL